jgi:hypothetical protein
MRQRERGRERETARAIKKKRELVTEGARERATRDERKRASPKEQERESERERARACARGVWGWTLEGDSGIVVKRCRQLLDAFLDDKVWKDSFSGVADDDV